MTVSFAPTPPAADSADAEPLDAVMPVQTGPEAQAPDGGAGPGGRADGGEPDGRSPAAPGRGGQRHRDAGQRPPSTPGPKLPRIRRPGGLPAAAHPGSVPEPQHRHLPGWVRRAHGQARPILADLLGQLSGEPRQHFEEDVRALVDGMSAGRFSLAWQYPQLIDGGWALVESNRRETEAQARRRQEMEHVRRRVGDQLREAGERLTPEIASRLRRTLQSAADVDAIRGVGSELNQVLSSARSVEERRRDREIDRTRERLRRSLPQAVAESPAESWQDALRRIADQVAPR